MAAAKSLLPMAVLRLPRHSGRAYIPRNYRQFPKE